jgi:hypothetical protein
MGHSEKYHPNALQSPHQAIFIRIRCGKINPCFVLVLKDAAALGWNTAVCEIPQSADA